MSRFILPFQSVFDANGVPLDGAKLYFYETGTSTPKDTYSDSALSVANANPVIANSQGEFGEIFLNGEYRVELKDKNDVTQPEYPADNVLPGDLEFKTDIAASGGSALVGFLGQGSGTVKRTLQDKSRDMVSDFNYMTAAEITDIQANTELVDVTGALQNAFSDQETLKKTLHLSAGKRLISGQLEYHGYGIKGEGRFSTIIHSTFTGGVLIKKMQSNDEGRLEDFTLDGPGSSVSGSVGFAADGSGAGWFRTQIKNVFFRAMERAATIEKSLFCIFDTWYLRDVKEGQFFVGGGAGWNTSWFNNEITFINCIWDECETYAIDFVGTGLAFAGTNTMQSGGDGIRIDRDTADRSRVNTLNNLYFEFNTGHDIKLKDTQVTLGPCMFQSGPVNTPLFNILADDTTLYVIGRSSFLDLPDKRISLINNSKYIAMHEEIVSSKIIADATSSYIYIPTLLEDKIIRQTLTDLGTTPVEINGGSRLANGSWKIYVGNPGSEFATGTIETSATGGAFRMTVFGRQMVEDTSSQFTINQIDNDYVLTMNSSTGVVSIATVSGTATGDTVVNLRQEISLAGEFI